MDKQDQQIMEISEDKIPPEFRDNLNALQAKVANEGIITFDIKLLENQSFGILASPDNPTRKILHDTLLDIIPAELIQKLIFQPQDGYHISLQWAAQVMKNSSKVESIYNLLRQSVDAQEAPHGKILFPFVSQKNIFAGFVEDGNRLSTLRQAANKGFETEGLPMGITYGSNNFYWISLVRFGANLEREDLDILQNLPLYVLDNVAISELVIANNDPFFSPERSDILKKIKSDDNTSEIYGN